MNTRCTRGRRPGPPLASISRRRLLQDQVEPVVAQLRVGLARARVQRDVEVHRPPDQLLDVPIGQDLAVRRHLQDLAAAVEGVQQVVDRLHHERLADRAVHEALGVVEERAEVLQRVERERRVGVIALELLVEVPLAVDARRLHVAGPVQVDAEADRRGRQLGPPLEHLPQVPHGVGVLSGDLRVARRVLVEHRRPHPHRERAAVSRVVAAGEDLVRPDLEAGRARRDGHGQPLPPAGEREHLGRPAGLHGQLLREVLELREHRQLQIPLDGRRVEEQPPRLRHPPEGVDPVRFLVVEAVGERHLCSCRQVSRQRPGRAHRHLQVGHRGT